MTEIKATPGPWRIGDAGWTVFGPKTDAPSPVTIATIKSKQDASLLASAPDLLEALYLALPYVEDQQYDTGYKPGVVKRAVSKIEATIARAEGR